MARYRFWTSVSVLGAIALLLAGHTGARGGATIQAVALDGTALSAGLRHTCALEMPTGAADCWGDNSRGQATDQAGPYGVLVRRQSFPCGEH